MSDYSIADPMTGRLVSRLRATADAYCATGEAIPDRTIRLLCDGFAAVHRLFANELEAALGHPTDHGSEMTLLAGDLGAEIQSDRDALPTLLARSCMLEDAFRSALRSDLPSDVDLLLYRVFAKVRGARERLLAALLRKPHLAQFPTIPALSHCA